MKKLSFLSFFLTCSTWLYTHEANAGKSKKNKNSGVQVQRFFKKGYKYTRDKKGYTLISFCQKNHLKTIFPKEDLKTKEENIFLNTSLNTCKTSSSFSEDSVSLRKISFNSQQSDRKQNNESFIEEEKKSSNFKKKSTIKKKSEAKCSEVLMLSFQKSLEQLLLLKQVYSNLKTTGKNIVKELEIFLNTENSSSKKSQNSYCIFKDHISHNKEYIQTFLKEIFDIIVKFRSINKTHGASSWLVFTQELQNFLHNLQQKESEKLSSHFKTSSIVHEKIFFHITDYVQNFLFLGNFFYNLQEKKNTHPLESLKLFKHMDKSLQEKKYENYPFFIGQLTKDFDYTLVLPHIGPRGHGKTLSYDLFIQQMNFSTIYEDFFYSFGSFVQSLKMLKNLSSKEFSTHKILFLHRFFLQPLRHFLLKNEDLLDSFSLSPHPTVVNKSKYMFWLNQLKFYKYENFSLSFFQKTDAYCLKSFFPEVQEAE